MTITSKIWSSLNKKDRELLKQIGLKPKIIPRPIPNRIKPPTPYCLKMITNCTLCGSKPIRYFRMVLSEDETYLTSVPITEEEANTCECRLKTTYSSTCPHCYEVLIKDWKKEDLVKALIKAYPLAAIGGSKWNK